MSHSQAFGDQLVPFVDQLLSRLVARGFAEQRDGRIRLTVAGRRAAGYRAGDVVGDANMLTALNRLARAVDLEVPHVL